MASESKLMKEYFEKINDEVLKQFEIANKAKSLGYDPDDEVVVPLAKNMAERVEGLISTVAPQIIGSGVVERIQELEREYGSQDWRVALTIAAEVAEEKFCKFETKKEAIEIGIRVGFAYVTVGVVGSPLEGFVEIKLKKRKDNGNEYFCLMYAGPIRSAGGTGASVSVLIADYVRKRLGYDVYDPTEKEIKRTYTELSDYHERVTNLQYFPSEEEAEFLTQHLPVQIDGDGSSDKLVSNYKDLERIETNQIRVGFCLVMAECLSLKAPKVLKQLNKWGHDMDMDHWAFLKDFVDLQKKMKAKAAKAGNIDEEVKVKPDGTYLKDLPAGRPVLTHPLRNGGFRLRYGRARTSGFSSDAVHPATMVVLDNFMAVGSQMKTERPGKSTTFSPCDRLDGPIVKLKNGSVMRFDDFETAKKFNKDIVEILYLGDILINQGDFSNRGHKLLPPGFVEEWWIHYLGRFPKEKVLELTSMSKEKLDELISDPIKTKVSFDEAKIISEKLGLPLHPRYIYYWNSIKPEQFLKLFESLKNSVIEESKIILYDFDENAKRALELIGVPHKVVSNEYSVIEGDDAKALQFNLGYLEKVPKYSEKVLDMVNSVAPVLIKDKCGHFIGGRMGRPEKAKMREMKGTPHVLFPVSDQGGRMRSFQSAFKLGYVESEFPNYYCDHCKKYTIYKRCENCGAKTKLKYFCRRCNKEYDEDTCPVHGKIFGYKKRRIDFDHYFKNALNLTGSIQIPKLIKGVRGTTNRGHIPEHLIKGIFRARHGVHVNKDGTTRYDMTEMPITHFKPKEVGATVDKLRKLGYEKDCYGNELVNENQILELKAQDIILPACAESPNTGADEVLFNVAGFLDDLLVHLYKQDPYYNLKSKNDLIGHLCVAMSPHTSAGIVCRIIGFSKVQAFFAHPYLHSIMRRDADGDEAAVMLLLDHLLNFSPKYLPSSRGSSQDAPLVLTSKLIPSEVDDMVFDMDVVWEYPLEFYESAEEYKNPWDIKIENVGDRLGTEKQYEGFGFTHDTTDFNNGVRVSSYKILPTMKDKVLSQMFLCEKIRAVDENDVARLVIERHFLRDTKGNLRGFSKQSFRCVKCNEIYRRPPLAGKCIKCGGKILFTVSEGSIVKYLEPSMTLAEKYHLPNYLKQSLQLLKNRIESIFGKSPTKQESLDKWFS